MHIILQIIHIFFQVLYPSTLSKILPQGQVLILSLLSAFAPLRHCTAFLSRQSLPEPSLSFLFLVSIWSPPPLPSVLCSLLSASSSVWHFAAEPHPCGLLAPSSTLLSAWGASGLCSFLDITSQCTWEMGNPSAWMLIEIHFINFSVSCIKKPLKRYLYLLFLIPDSCCFSSPYICLLVHQQVFSV